VTIDEDEPTGELQAPEQVRLRELPKYVPRSLGRYEIVGGLGHGGMATVYLARTAGESGFHRLFAIKVLHPHLSEDTAFVTMLLDEARIAARLHHPNVVPIVDLGVQDGLHYVVMEYVEGCSMFALLAKSRDARPPRLIVPLLLDALAGLHAAHELRGDDDEPLQLVHRDVSPQNVLVGVEGIGRLTDFGVARAEARINTTRPGHSQIKGKVGFLSPEQLRGQPIDRRSDVFSAGVMLWSALTGKRLFHDPASDAATMTKTLTMEVPKPSTVGLRPPVAFDDVCLRALERDPNKRFATALEMEDALRAAATAAGMLGTRQELAEWMTKSFGDELAARRAAVRKATVPQDRVSASDVSSAAVSGMRMMPAVGSIVPEESTPAAGVVAEPPSSRKLIVAGAAAVGALAVLGVVIALVVSRSSNGGAPAQTATSVATMRAAPTATATTTATATATTTAAVPATASAIATTVAETEASAAPKPTAFAPRSAIRHVPPHKTEPTLAPTATAQRWDKDSPLPPP